ncbi:alpha/beta hydrolase [Deinococcus cavernae]|uniref:Alpha/beta hydrolase n=1 Tax=Deinococcus cavernae TaxID=2320857 RepID=A0A418V9U3_9DEIO|nr:alpha/beta hydrolase [Deinococcus cavernae]RJF72839.1 alpha/beta hydrolase [Deinococcus cavernae]
MPRMTHDDYTDLPDEVFEERLNGADLYFEVSGPEDINTEDSATENSTEPPIVFLHGGPGYNSYSFRALLGDRLAADFPERRVVYLDQRGSGRSGALEDTEQGGDTLDIDTLVEDLEAVRDFLGVDRIVPLGHGFGALVALDYARRYPLHTARVIVVNPWVHFPELAYTLLAEASAQRSVPLEDPAEQIRSDTPEGQYPSIGAARIEAAFSLLNARDLLNLMQFTDAPTRMHLEFTDAEGQLAGGGEVQQALVNQGLWEFEYPPFLTEIKRPVFVIAGAGDRTSYPEQVGWVADLAGGDVTVLNTGHYPWLDDEDDFIEALGEALTR